MDAYWVNLCQPNNQGDWAKGKYCFSAHNENEIRKPGDKVPIGALLHYYKDKAVNEEKKYQEIIKSKDDELGRKDSEINNFLQENTTLK